MERFTDIVLGILDDTFLFYMNCMAATAVLLVVILLSPFIAVYWAARGVGYVISKAK